MTFNIETFKQKGLVFGGARSSLFKCDVTFPARLASYGLTEKLSFVAKSATIPPSSVDSIDVGYFGRKIKVAGDRAFPDWTIMVLNDEDFKIRSGLEAWLNQMNTMVSNLNIGGGSQPSLYKVDSTVTQYSKTGKEIRKYKFVGMFPTLVGAISLDWDDTNRIQTFDATFAYDYWIPINDANSVPYSADTGASDGTPSGAPPLRGSLP